MREKIRQIVFGICLVSVMILELAPIAFAQGGEECSILSAAAKEEKREVAAFNGERFTAAKATYLEMFKNQPNATEVMEGPAFPKTGEEFLAFLEASAEVKLPGALTPSEVWMDASISKDPRIIKARERLGKLLEANLPWARTRQIEGKILVDVEVPKKMEFGQTLKLFRELYKLDKLVGAARRGDPGYIAGIVNTLTGKMPPGSTAKPTAFWQRVQDRYSSSVDRLIEERIVNDIVEYDAIEFLQRSGFVNEFRWTDGVRRAAERNPGVMSVAKQTTLQYITYSLGLGFFPVWLPPARTFDRTSLDRTVRNSLATEGFKPFRNEIRRQLGYSPHAEYMIGKARIVFASVAAAAVLGIVYDQMNSPAGQQFFNVGRMWFVSDDDLKKAEEKKSDEQLRNDRYENEISTYEMMDDVKIDAETRRIVNEINREITAERTPRLLLPTKANVMNAANRDVIINMVNSYYRWHFVVPKDKLRLWSSSAAPSANSGSVQ